MFASRAIAGPHGQKLRETNDRLRTHNDRVKEKKKGPPHTIARTHTVKKEKPLKMATYQPEEKAGQPTPSGGVGF